MNLIGIIQGEEKRNQQFFSQPYTICDIFSTNTPFYFMVPQGSFLRTDFSFKVYYPTNREVQDSQVKENLDQSTNSNTTQSQSSMEVEQSQPTAPSSTLGTLDAFFAEASQS